MSFGQLLNRHSRAGGNLDLRKQQYSKIIKDPSFPRRRESRPLDSGNIQRLSESPRFWIPTFVE
ncbi:hypothetical protein A6J47_013160 [Neisseria meningitidis]|nr:hypothetical protein A6J47_013160 [Neisseria meningitidis]